MTIDRWLTLSLFIVGCVVTWFVSRHFYRRSDKRRTPTFVVRPERKVLVAADFASVTKFSVLYEGGEVGKKGITEARIYFWNSGTLPILSADVLEPFTISMPGDILSCSVLKSSRDVIALRVSVKDFIFDNQRMELRFAVLEPGDGATVQAIYDGPPDGKIEFTGACVGAAKPVVLPPDNIYFTSVASRLNQMYAPFYLGLLAVVPILIFFGVSWVLRRFLGERATAIIGWTFFGCIGTLIVFVVGAMLWDQYRKIKAPYLPPDVRP